MTKRDRLTFSLILAFNGLSAVTSAFGLWFIFDQNSAAIPVPGLSIILAAAATLLVQASILRFWGWAAVSRTWKRLVVFALCGMLWSAVSGLTASGIYNAVLNKSGLETYRTQENADTIIEPVGRVSSKVREVAVNLDAIALDTRRKAELESRGNSCVGGKPQEGRGPRFRLRQRHAREAEQMAALGRALADRAIGIMHDLQGDNSEAGMLRAFRAAHDLVSHPDLTRITVWLRQEAAGFGAEFIDPESNRSFVCRDPELQDRMLAAAKMLSGGFDLPLVPPRPVKDLPLIDLIGKSYKDAFELAGMLIGWLFTRQIDPLRYQAVSYSLAGYIPALLVELVIIILIFAEAIMRRDRGCDWTDEEIFGADRRDLPEAVRRRNRRWVELILSSLIEDRRGWFIARPIDGAPDVAAQWLRMTLIRKLPTDPDLNPSIPLGNLYPEWVQARADIHGDARHFALHPITKAQLEWLRRAAADLELELDSDPGPQHPHAPDDNVVDLQTAGAARKKTSGAWKPVLVILLSVGAGIALSYSGVNLPEFPKYQSADATRPDLRIKADQNGHFHVTPQINGLPIKALVDTGATTVSLSYEDAERLNLAPERLTYDVTISTANGRALAARVRLAEVRLGPIRVEDIDALIGKQGALHTSLLGMSFLKNVRLRIEGGELAFYK